MLAWQAARNSARNVLAHMRVRPDGFADLESIAAKYDAQVFFRPMEPELSGFIVKQANSSPEIFINADEPIERQRFTLAHEIGHLVERGQYAKDRDYSFMDYRSSTDYDLHEFFADEFAGALLMPAREFTAVYRDRGEFGTAVHFGVTVSAVNKRAKRLQQNPDEEF
ncbi:ImmA/IrrE family metallo-endopeptidase [uncultured Corynebacterium sp.]|uniref:ImmA/IrrE family metallo-endopeptidase n=1 Tax=uncultured Corynebacterium sp. TaxID=159447 RepID=UPI0025E99B4C|nr:ImmA/IrrE family metallo-endopeptidase [uncultured Corynebacterium sp.]